MKYHGETSCVRDTDAVMGEGVELGSAAAGARDHDAAADAG